MAGGNDLAAEPRDPISTGKGSVPFDSFCQSERPRLFALVAAVAGWDEADDLTQEVLVRAQRSWDQVGTYDRPDLWLRRVAINLASSTRRRWRVEQRAMDRLARQRRPAPETPEPDPELWRAVRRLPARQAQIVGLHYLDDLTHAEIAGVLGISEATVRVHLHRARLTLARQLGEAIGPEREVDES